MNESTTPNPLWTPLPANQRRVLGVLIEKAKTTPNAYPLTQNGLVTGCNQKSNRFPTMDLDPDDVEDALEALRQAKAVNEVHGDGRAVKYRHYAKEWLGVDGTELAVMAELLLRGAQTIGELRGRAARMAKGKLNGMNELRPILDRLVQAKLVIPLTPAGRGQVVTHGLYLESERQRLRREYNGGQAISPSVESHSQSAATAPDAWAPPTSSPSSATSPAAVQAIPTHSALESSDPGNATVSELREDLHKLHKEVARLQKEIEDIWATIR